MTCCSGIPTAFTHASRSLWCSIPRKEMAEGTGGKARQFRFEQRFETRTAAIHWLLEFALKQNPKPNK